MNRMEGDSGVRHHLSDRLFHWVMAVCIFILAGTAFLPIIGIKFNWVPVHWWTGAILVFAVLFHLYRVFAVHGIGAMMPGLDDAREGLQVVLNRETVDLQPAKYDTFQKMYHWAAALTVIVTIVTGVMMLAKIDTVFWKRSPAIMSDSSWGIIYSIHGLGAMLLLFLVIVHVYFAFLPNHRSLLVSMLKGHGPELARKGREL